MSIPACCSDIPILLTACINPGKIIALERSQPEVRLQDYRAALELWLARSASRSIVFCDNSGYDLTPLADLCQERKKRDVNVEFLSFAGQDFDPSLGKGYGEMRILRHAFENSKLLADCEYFMKVTGRLYLGNASSILRGVQACHADVYCDLRSNLTLADSRVFCATKAFWRQFLSPRATEVNDSKHIIFEHVLARAVHDCMAHGGRWSPLPRAADLRGIAGTTNTMIPHDLPRRLTRELFRWLKSATMVR